MRRRRGYWLRRLALAALLIWLAVSIGLAVVIHTFGYDDAPREADVIVVLGAGLRRDNTPTRSHVVRIRRGAELWEEGYAARIICTGGMPGYATRSEADACLEILLARGVPRDAILLEDRSRSTEENALYARELMDANGWQTALVVSERYHLYRASYIFHAAGIDATMVPTSVSHLTAARYFYSLAREVLALEWQLVTDLLNLPVTYVPLV